MIGGAQLEQLLTIHAPLVGLLFANQSNAGNDVETRFGLTDRPLFLNRQSDPGHDRTLASKFGLKITFDLQFGADAVGGTLDATVQVDGGDSLLHFADTGDQRAFVNRIQVE